MNIVVSQKRNWDHPRVLKSVPLWGIKLYPFSSCNMCQDQRQNVLHCVLLHWDLLYCQILTLLLLYTVTFECTYLRNRPQTKHRTCGSLTPEKNGPLFAPQSWFSGFEILGGGNIVNCVCARVFSTADFAPLVLKATSEVHCGQLWGAF